MLNQHQPTYSQQFTLFLEKVVILQFQSQPPQKPQNPVKSDMGIHIDHLCRSVVGGGDIFVGDIPVFIKGIKSGIEVLCIWEKIASAGVIQLRLQALFDILCLDDLNDLLSLDDVPIGSIYAETVYCLIAIVVSDIESPQQCVMIHTFFGRLYTSGTTVRTMQDTSYPQYQTVELTTPVLTAAHGFLDLFFDILIAVIYIFLGSVTRQM